MNQLVYPGPIAIRECCWACKGTGRTFVGVNPLRFRPCFMCYGTGGRGSPRTPQIAAMAAPREKLECPPTSATWKS